MNPIFYKGYRAQRNCITQEWYAVPEVDTTMERKLTAPTISSLRILIDDATATQTANPWQLPQRSLEVAQAA